MFGPGPVQVACFFGWFHEHLRPDAGSNTRVRLGAGTSMANWREVATNETQRALESGAKLREEKEVGTWPTCLFGCLYALLFGFLVVYVCCFSPFE